MCVEFREFPSKCQEHTWYPDRSFDPESGRPIDPNYPDGRLLGLGSRTAQGSGHYAYPSYVIVLNRLNAHFQWELGTQMSETLIEIVRGARANRSRLT